VAGLGLCAAGWLVLTPFAFGYQSRGWQAATQTDLATGGGLAVICVTTLTAWTLAWRRALRAEGVLSRPERGPARARRRRERAGDGQGAGQSAAADPEQVLTALRALLAPTLDTPAEEIPAAVPVIPGPRSAPEAGRVPRDCQARYAGPGGMPAGPQVVPAGPQVVPAGPQVVPAGPQVVPAGPQVVPAGPEGIAVIESMLAGAELLMTGCDDEEAW
jgi:hypothetical protein